MSIGGSSRQPHPLSLIAQPPKASAAPATAAVLAFAEPLPIGARTDSPGGAQRMPPASTTDVVPSTIHL
jgi:hypothetical protein